MYNNDYNNYDQNSNKIKSFFDSFKINKKIMVLLIVVILVIIGIYLYINNIAYLDSYEYLEKTLVEKTKEYVINNNLKSNKEFYITSNKLNVPLKDGCQSISGVLVNGDEYQAYLLCNDYETDIIDNNNDYINLNGKEIVFMNKGSKYTEAMYEEQKNVEVNINGTVGSEEGVYNLEYIVLQYDVIVSKLKRKIIVLDNKIIDSFYPTIKLLGNDIEYLERSSTYVDKGATATDNVDGVIKDIKVNGKVNTNIDGEYNLTYTIVNSRGYASSVKRKVVVVKPAEKIAASSLITPINLTNGNVKIVLSVYGSNYSYTQLPNGITSNQSFIEYEVTDNGNYDFLVYDLNGNSITETVSITNINREPPKGTCTVLVDFDHADISVAATSNVEISGYKYIINNIETDYTTSFSYRVNSNSVKNVSVKVKDIVGNLQELKCEIKLLDPTIGNNNVKYYAGFGDTYVIPKTNNDLDAFVRRTNGKIAQYIDRSECGDACLSFAYYHAYHLQFGNMNNLNLYDACHYQGVPIGFQQVVRTEKKEIFDIIMEEIRRGRVLVLQVKGGSGRHYVTVVGYRRSVYNSSMMTDDDLLIIDAWDGNLKSVKGSNRKLYYETNQTRKQGYMVYKMSR